MVNYVLVHGGNMTTGTWNRLTRGKHIHTADGTMGGMIWDPVIPVLMAKGHSACAPSLSDEHKSTLSDHIMEICRLIEDRDLHDIVLTGHSYGGMIITGVADRMAGRIHRLVYLDAALPEPGESLYDLIRQGMDSPSVSQPDLPEPFLPYVEKLKFDPHKIGSLKKTYILCTKSEFVVVTQHAQKKIAASPHNWTYVELPASHVPMADLPDEISRLLLDAAE
jgi:pimeloyl-ACP methyl ester carboxylesterase